MNNRTYIVTGCSSGIGKELAKQCAARGYQVINISRNPSGIDGVVDIEFDLMGENEYDRLSDEIRKNVVPDSTVHLIHNAFAMFQDSIETVNTGALKDLLQLGVIAPTQLTQKVLDLFTPGSSVVYVSSIMGSQSVPDTYSYTIVKHAVNGMMKSSAITLSPKKVHSVAVCPGVTLTENIRNYCDDEVLDQMRSQMLYGELCEPERVANTIVFCAENPLFNNSVVDINYGQQ